MKKLSLAAALLCCALPPAAWANPTTEIDKLFAAMGLEHTFEQTLEQAKEHIAAMQSQQDPSQAPLAELMKQFLGENPNWENLQPEIERLYGKYSEAISDSEWRELAELYTSDIGQKSLEQLSKLMELAAQFDAGEFDAAQLQDDHKALFEQLSKELERLGLEL